jgi:hypothetical protein
MDFFQFKIANIPKVHEINKSEVIFGVGAGRGEFIIISKEMWIPFPNQYIDP